MKRIVILFIIIFIGVSAVFAKTQKSEMPSIKFNGGKYSLLYSAKNPQTGAYMNEYYKPNEGYTSWNELIGVHYFPDAYSPIDQAKSFRAYLSEARCPSAIDVNENENTAVLDFMLMDTNKLPIILEFNIFKYEKSPVCGTIALQYAKRYRINNSLEIDSVKKSFKKSRDNYIKQVKKTHIPVLVTVDVDKGRYTNNEGIVDEPAEEFK